MERFDNFMMGVMEKAYKHHKDGAFELIIITMLLES